MIEPVHAFVEQFVKEKGARKNVLEVGSRDVNGGVRNLFGCSYTGIDLIGGTGVDVVMDAMDIKKQFEPGSFDTVICLETLEHTKDPVRIVKNMRWVLKRGGWMILTTPCIGHPEHDWPSDYYRFFENTYRDVFFKGFIDTYFKTMLWDSPGLESPNTRYPHVVLGWGKKP